MYDINKRKLVVGHSRTISCHPIDAANDRKVRGADKRNEGIFTSKAARKTLFCTAFGYVRESCRYEESDEQAVVA